MRQLAATLFMLTLTLPVFAQQHQGDGSVPFIIKLKENPAAGSVKAIKCRPMARAAAKTSATLAQRSSRKPAAGPTQARISLSDRDLAPRTKIQPAPSGQAPVKNNVISLQPPIPPAMLAPIDNIRRREYSDKLLMNIKLNEEITHLSQQRDALFTKKFNMETFEENKKDTDDYKMRMNEILDQRKELDAKITEKRKKIQENAESVRN